jgi:branched-chain amino acid transport system permease protein
MAAVKSLWEQGRTWASQNQRLVIVLLLLLAMAYPFIVRAYYRSLMTEVLLFAIFAMSLDLLLGYTGLPSFGHAAYFGVGAYSVAFIASTNQRAFDLTSNLLLTIPVVVVISALFALVIGFFAIRTSGTYFLMITLASGQMLFSIVNRWSEVTGGTDGLSGVVNPVIGLGPLSIEFSPFQNSFYYLTLILFVLSWLVMRRIINSPFGWTLQGIRENEGRMKALGYNTFRYKLAVFAIAGAFAGLAGLLSAHFFKNATPETLFWATSGEAMIALIIGGPGTLSGALIGSLVVKLFPLLVSSYTERWKLLQGLLFIAFVVFVPNGIWGYLTGDSSDEEVQE